MIETSIFNMVINSFIFLLVLSSLFVIISLILIIGRCGDWIPYLLTYNIVILEFGLAYIFGHDIIFYMIGSLYVIYFVRKDLKKLKKTVLDNKTSYQDEYNDVLKNGLVKNQYDQ